MPELREVIGETKNIYCQWTVCQTCVLAEPLNTKVSPTKVGNQAKAQKYSGKKLYFVPI